MKVLSIGNSFSQDAHKWLHDLANANGVDMETVNLYIGGCSLETHYINAVNQHAFYDLERNGQSTFEKISITDALNLEKWDVITLQQVSYLSGVAESYEPYLSFLANLVRSTCPNAKVYFHQTWAYETDASHSGFAKNYQNDQKLMFERIIAVTTEMAKSIHTDIIPVGKVIQNLRENTTEFDYLKSGVSLCRDGYHLTYDYGRYAAAATWLRVLSGKLVSPSPFQDFDIEILKEILSVVNAVCEIQ